MSLTGLSLATIGEAINHHAALDVDYLMSRFGYSVEHIECRPIDPESFFIGSSMFVGTDDDGELFEMHHATH